MKAQERAIQAHVPEPNEDLQQILAYSDTEDSWEIEERRSWKGGPVVVESRYV